MANAADLNGLFGPPEPATLMDPWLASSLMQKAIRRGEAELAIRAARSLHSLRGRSVFRRLAIVACEDVGIADMSVVSSVIAACSDAALRSHAGGDAVVLAHLVESLARSPKDRSADLLASIIHSCPQLAPVRAAVERMSIGERISLASNPATDFFERAVAAWYASGVEWGREKRVGNGNLPSLLHALRDGGIPERWCVTGKRALAMAREPLIVMMIMLSAESAAAHPAKSVPMPSSCDCNGIPSFALDKHTRLGLKAIRRFATENAEVRSTLSAYVSDFRAIGALGIAAFYCDGAPVRFRLDWPRSWDLELRGTTSDLLSAGVSAEGIGPLRQAVADNLKHLNRLRAEVAGAAQSGSARGGRTCLG